MRTCERNHSSHRHQLRGLGLIIGLVILILPGCQPGGSVPETGFRAHAPFPTLGKANSIKPGVLAHEVNLGPPGKPRRLWIYLPDPLPSGPLPCVLVGPAGSPLISGMALGDGDRAEQMPYAAAGFAVVAFDIDVNVPDNASDQVVFAGVTAFRSARAGRENVKLALDFALERIPNIDPTRIAISGHSSAATLSLIAAADDPRIRACIAFAPATDVVARLAPITGEFERALPGFAAFVRDSSPLTHVAKITSPTFLFCATDDTNTKAVDIRQFATTLKASNPNVTFVEVPRGGHYQSMISEGIPKAIAWLKELPAAKAK